MVVLLHISEHSKWDCFVSWHSKQANRRCLEMVMQLITRHGVEFFGRWCGEEQPQPGRIIWTTNTWFLMVPLFQSDPRFSWAFQMSFATPCHGWGAPSGHISFLYRVAEPGRARQVSEFKDHELAGLGASFVLNYMDDVLRRLVIRQVGTGRSGMAANWLSRPPSEWTRVNVSLITTLSLVMFVGFYPHSCWYVSSVFGWFWIYWWFQRRFEPKPWAYTTHYKTIDSFVLQKVVRMQKKCFLFFVEKTFGTVFFHLDTFCKTSLNHFFV